MKITFIGHSHISCIYNGYSGYCEKNDSYHIEAKFLQLINKELIKPGCPFPDPHHLFDHCDQEKLRKAVAIASHDADLTILCPRGTEHHIISSPIIKSKKSIDELLLNRKKWISGLANFTLSTTVIIPPPPPIESAELILKKPGLHAKAFAEHGITSAPVRLQAWLSQNNLIKELAESVGLVYLDLPTSIFDGGFRKEIFYGGDPFHANAEYGKELINYIAKLINNKSIALPSCSKVHTNEVNIATNENRNHPYVNLPDYAFWKQGVAQVSMQQFDPIVDVPFKILKDDKVATAGSCFAQHISKWIRNAGFNFMISEHPQINQLKNSNSYYDFSARYGNIYTARQLLQLFDRAFGEFEPVEKYWSFKTNRFCDPFRPRIEPDGFISHEEISEDRVRHLAAVRSMFTELDVFIFTLGLTECWMSRVDGSVFPIAPGVAGGAFDPLSYEFTNFKVDEVITDLQLFIQKLRLINPSAKLIFTVSPVPLAATYEPKHVLLSTTYSKSVLRVAAETITNRFENVYYFPSYEIITGNYMRSHYFSLDLRTITQEGVEHVMTVFMRHLTENKMKDPTHTEISNMASSLKEEMAFAEIACDEEVLERS